jgi:hypothetical protein
MHSSLIGHVGDVARDHRCVGRGTARDLAHDTERENQVAIFAFYVMVDWSGANRRRANRDNCIWIAYGTR